MLVWVLKVCCGSSSCCLLCVKPKAVIVKLFRHALLGQVLVLPAGFVFASRHRAVSVAHCGGDFKVVFCVTCFLHQALLLPTGITFVSRH